MLQHVCENCVRIFEEEKAPSAPYVRYLMKETGKKKFSDEAHFDLAGYVNKQNYRIWGTENSYVYIKK